MTVQIITGDCRQALHQLADNSVHCCITSPPYFGLRDYGTASWDGGDADCTHEVIRNSPNPKHPGNGSQNGSPRKGEELNRQVCRCGARRIDQQIGLEQTPEEYVEQLVQVFREVRRVLRDDGTLWLNLGDSYAGNIRSPGLKPKDLMGIPWTVAFALRADGWWLRQDIIWSKPNPMPESITDRCTKAHEYLFLLSKSAQYYYDQEAILEPVAPASVRRLVQDITGQSGSEGPSKTNGPMKAVARSGNLARKSGGARGCPEGSESNVCGSVPWEGETRNKRTVWTVATIPSKEKHFATFPPKLIEPCVLAGSPASGTILDPFGGIGTTGLVADRLGRNCILIELNERHARTARRRIVSDAPLFAQVDAS